MQSKARAIVVMVLIMGLMVGCSTGSLTKEEGDALLKSFQASRQEWNKTDPQFYALPRRVTATLSSLRSPKAACSWVGLTVGVLSTRKANTSVTRT
jgi:hypothetical protein